MLKKYNYIKNLINISFKELKEKDINNIVKFQNDNINPELFCKLTKEEIEEAINNDKIIGAFFNNQIIGFCLIIFPCQDERSLYRDLNENFLDVITFDAVIVHNEFRGLGLQCKFLDITKDLAQEKQCKFIGATVSPDNFYSKRNFLKYGFKVVCQKEKYGGLERLIMKYELK